MKIKGAELTYTTRKLRNGHRVEVTLSFPWEPGDPSKHELVDMEFGFVDAEIKMSKKQEPKLEMGDGDE